MWCFECTLCAIIVTVWLILKLIVKCSNSFVEIVILFHRHREKKTAEKLKMVFHVLVFNFVFFVYVSTVWLGLAWIGFWFG